MVFKPFKTFYKYDFPMIFPAAGAAFLPERLPKSARNRVLMLPRERAELTDHFPKLSCKSVVACFQPYCKGRSGTGEKETHSMNVVGTKIWG